MWVSLVKAFKVGKTFHTVLYYAFGQYNIPQNVSDNKAADKILDGGSIDIIYNLSYSMHDHRVNDLVLLLKLQIQQ